MKRMKILVFDDTLLHRQAAELVLGKDHDLTVVGTYDEAQAALLPKRDTEKADQLLPGLLEKAGLPANFKPWEKDKEIAKDDRDKYYAAQDKATKMATSYPDFDVVLTDLLVPASRQAQGGEGERLVGQEMPLGTTIALLALTAGVKNVAVVTDKNHHSHPASAAFDCFGSCKNKDINLWCTNRVGRIEVDQESGEAVDLDSLDSEENLKKYPYLNGKTWGDRKGLTQGGKNWLGILKTLLKEDQED